MPDQPSLFDPDPPRGRSGSADDDVIQALRAAGIGLEAIVDVVTGGVEAPPLNTVDRREVVRWVERAADRMIDPDQGRRLRRAVLDLLDAQFDLDYHARVHARRAERLCRG